MDFEKSLIAQTEIDEHKKNRANQPRQMWILENNSGKVKY